MRHISRLEPEPLGRLCGKLLGDDWMLYTPDDRTNLLKNKGIELDEAATNKLEAFVTCKTCEAPFQEWLPFEKVIIGLNDRTPFFDRLEKANPSEIAYGVFIMGEPKGEEVKKYVAACLFEDGLAIAPKILSFAQPFLYQLQSDIGKAIADLWKEKTIIPKPQQRKLEIIDLYLKIKKNKIRKDNELVDKILEQMK